MQLPFHEARVRPEWIDANGHMNLAYYVVVFDHATDGVFDVLGIGDAYRQASGHACFAVETHTVYARETVVGDPLRVASRLLGADGKRLHLFHEMLHVPSGEVAAAHEIMTLHVDLASRRTAPWPDPVRARLEAAVAGDTRPWPAAAGRRIGLRRA